MRTIHTCTTHGIEALPVFIETDIANGMNQFTIVGLPDTSVKESRDRIRAAMKHAQLPFPRGRITTNLAPADIRKQGPIFDLPIALSILAAQETLPSPLLSESIIIGELALDGALRPVRGALSAAILAKRKGYKSIIVPYENGKEASAIKQISVFAFHSLQELAETLRTNNSPTPVESPHFQDTHEPEIGICFSFIKGQESAKRGLEIAAAGGHNVLLSGPPGTGKTLLASSVPSILPPLTEEEAIEVTNIASVAGLLPNHHGLLRQRPFRTPHHSASSVALVGGGSWPTPGEISLAHRGVLFLDELPEFSRHALEHLRGPLEDGEITISRIHGSTKFPCAFLLLSAMNPCPCGHATNPFKACTCSPAHILRYQKRLSGPLLDRMDLRIEVSHIPPSQLLHTTPSEPSVTIRARVLRARQKQTERFQTPGFLNAHMSIRDLSLHCPLSSETKQLLSLAIDRQHLSPRSVARVHKMARTIADLADSSTIDLSHLAEALQFRGSLPTDL